jgi:hypothetical protein
MKKYALLILITILYKFSLANNIDLTQTRENCNKLDGFSNQYKQSIAENIGVAPAGIKLIGGMWRGFCQVQVNSPKGVFNCAYSSGLLSDDGGKTAFVAGYGNCEKTQ